MQSSSESKATFLFQTSPPNTAWNSSLTGIISSSLYSLLVLPISSGALHARLGAIETKTETADTDRTSTKPDADALALLVSFWLTLLIRTVGN